MFGKKNKNQEKPIKNTESKTVESETEKNAAGAEYFEKITQSFEVSARRWELVVFPALFAFVVLASYGFYLIFSLTKDISFIAKSVDRNMTVIAQRMDSMAGNVDNMSIHVEHMSVNMRNMTKNITTVSTTMERMEPMLRNMDSMNRSLQAMTATTSYMQRDMGNMNRSISRPISFMNNFIPW